MCIGALPATGLLEGSRPTLDNGVACDSRCRAAGGIYAVGGIAPCQAKLQAHGFVPADAEADVVEGDVTARRFAIRYRSDSRGTGVLGRNMPQQTRPRRQEIVDATAAPTD
ncbi:hypothetical protein [Streptomyces sp. NPDC048277]|uniref:hypothetical protein n=1 Tax=Streptomyces sp. NPDC048277 TaxID=3155027 RepID=UPI0033CB9342